MKSTLRSNPPPSSRNYELAARVDRLSDHAFVDVNEVAATTGFSVNSLRNKVQRIRLNMPEPNEKVRHLTWRLGEIRRWQSGLTGCVTKHSDSADTTVQKKLGRPSDSLQMGATYLMN